MSARNAAIQAALEQPTPKAAVLAIINNVPMELRAYHRALGDMLTPVEKSNLADAIVNWMSAEYGISLWSTKAAQ